ncbi:MULTISPECIES: EmrA/EmrK family multidrug efflux transporter periplasmic adaptor subunit [Sphingobium]|uniref:EmrA/EmrK family multidrug efflux transporter periplasmic adaptor subunit n=1 Tax=Sphingobium sp. MI1205 TaxID=407020 RepID=UPI00077007B3|nr:EmrA/EmrK family multidrug efflux transporter periplasmic adaptor subunit [Sphingobium sp. MI1205]AMK19093.1 efflux pump membrane protein [Sphingobium sp. MI1205]
MADAVPEFTADTGVADRKERMMTQRKKWLVRLGLAVLIIGAVYAIWYLLVGRNHVGTDNAYVNAEIAQVTPLISAQAIEVRVTDTQAVKRGDILVRLDPTNARIALAQAEADLAEARRRFRQTAATSTSLAAQVQARAADINQASAQLAVAQADFDKARIDLQRREALAPEGAVSGDEVTSARKAFAAARAGLEQAKAGVAMAQATRGAAEGQLAANNALVRGSTEETDPAVLTAKAKLKNAQLDLERTVIRAPIDGVVTRRQVQVGQRVAQGNPIMSIVPLSQVYVDANFKERQLRQVRIGMPARVVADIYGGDVVYHGKVVGFSGGTGSSLALIPAQNATGNWIKVVQRLPVRIALDPKELAAHPLRVGLSTEVEIDLSAD